MWRPRCRSWFHAAGCDEGEGMFIILRGGCAEAMLVTTKHGSSSWLGEEGGRDRRGAFCGLSWADLRAEQARGGGGGSRENNVFIRYNSGPPKTFYFPRRRLCHEPCARAASCVCTITCLGKIIVKRGTRLPYRRAFRRTHPHPASCRFPRVPS